MKKRLLALILTMILALTLVVPAFMDDGGVPLPTGVKELPPDYFVKLPASGTSIMSPAPYAIISAEDWVKETFRIPWKTFVAKEVMLNGKYDISKLISGVKKESFLVIPQDGTIVTTGKQEVLNASKMASLTSVMTATNVEVFRVLKPADKPKAPKPSYDKKDGYATYTFTGTAVEMEYQKLGASSWTPITNSIMEIKQEEYKVEYYIRAKGVGTATSVSASVKVTVPALTNAPTTKLDIAKGEIKLKKGWEVKVSGDATVTSLAAAKTLLIGEVTDIDKGTISRNEQYIEYRVPPTEKKAGSTWSKLYLDNVGLGEELKGDAKVFFTFGAKNTVAVVGSIPIQAKIKEKWKTVKSIKYTDFAFASGSAEGTLEVRMAGTKTKLPGASSILKINATGELTLTGLPTT